MENKIISIFFPLLQGFVFLVTALKPKMILTMFRAISLYPRKAGSLREAYTIAQREIENEDNGCWVVFLVIFGLSGSILTLCFLSDGLSTVFQ